MTEIFMPRLVAAAPSLSSRGWPTDLVAAGVTLNPSPAKQFGQLGDVGCDPASLVLREPLHRPPAAGLILEIDVDQRLAGGVRHLEALGDFLDTPWWREAARGHWSS